MESFYGGRPGNPFILKGVQSDNSTQCFSKIDDIEQAIANGHLKYGDYAFIGPDSENVENIGKIYRVNEKNMPIYMGQFAMPTIKLTSGDGGVTMVDPDTQKTPELNFGTSGEQVLVDVSVPYLKINIDKTKASGSNLIFTTTAENNNSRYKPQLKLETPPPVYIGQENNNTYQVISEDSHLYPDDGSNIYSNPAAGSIIFIVENNSNSNDFSQS